MNHHSRNVPSNQSVLAGNRSSRRHPIALSRRLGQAEFNVISCFIRTLYCSIRGLYCFIRGLYCFIRGLYCFIRGLYCSIWKYAWRQFLYEHFEIVSIRHVDKPNWSQSVDHELQRQRCKLLKHNKYEVYKVCISLRYTFTMFMVYVVIHAAIVALAPEGSFLNGFSSLREIFTPC
jgi:hypothetical protein